MIKREYSCLRELVEDVNKRHISKDSIVGIFKEGYSTNTYYVLIYYNDEGKQ